ncbi:hypothetical protein C8R46DRAFT_1347049 [Mycena filopes]|nr:hypothetical protein C8R46DRAFT_1347049 [Mycena filopes]
MPKFDFNADEASLLKAYRISSLHPSKWEDIDPDSVAGSTGAGEGDPLGLGASVNAVDIEVDSKSAVSITSKSFDPKAFLSAVHPNANYQDLSHGIQNLQSSIDARSEAIRTLVEKSETGITNEETLTSNLVAQLRTAVAVLETKHPESVVEKCVVEPVWTAVSGMVTSLSAVMLSPLRNVWRISKDFMDGRYKRPQQLSSLRRTPAQCPTMALDIIKLYITLVSQFFGLADMASMTSPGADLLLPVNSNSLCTSYHLLKILGVLEDTINHLSTLEISSEATSRLSTFLESIRRRFEDILIGSWLRDAIIFHHLETWIPSALDASATHYLTHIELFQRRITSAAFKIAGGVDPASTDIARLPKQNPTPAAFVSKITKAFVDALYAFLDGLVYLGSAESIVVMEEGEVTALNWGELLDTRDPDTRTLVVSNLRHLAESILPTMVSSLETAFGISTPQDRQTLMTVVRELDRTLFEEYTKPKVDYLATIIQGSMLDPRMDWHDDPAQQIRPYVHEALNYLVAVHAQVSAISPGLRVRTLNTLVDALASETLHCVQDVPRFEMAGMLRARLEVDFMQQTLGHYVSAGAAEQLAELYTVLERVYVRRPGEKALQVCLDVVGLILAEKRLDTRIQFLCFADRDG